MNCLFLPRYVTEKEQVAEDIVEESTTDVTEETINYKGNMTL